METTHIQNVEDNSDFEDALEVSPNFKGEVPTLDDDDSYLSDAELLHLKSERLRRARHYIEDRKYVAHLNLDYDFD